MNVYIDHALLQPAQHALHSSEMVIMCIDHTLLQPTQHALHCCEFYI